MVVDKREYLEVYLSGKYIGNLYSHQASLEFRYDKEYLQNENAHKLSASMPLQEEAFNHQVTYAFFSGLLPDEYVRKRLARYLRLSEKNIYGLLKEIGGECAGAVAVYPKDAYPSGDLKGSYRILEDDEAHDILLSLDKHPMMAGEDDIRISGAGAQNKLIISFVDNKIAIPRNGTPSTHIIKPAIKDLEGTVQNEFFCMQLAKDIGLPVPEVKMYWLKENPYYLIERYDRLIYDGEIMRLHQEDICQALHIPPECKYENEGGPSVSDIFQLLDERIRLGVMAGRNKIVMLQAIIFNFLIGNGDAHGKNFSLLYNGRVEGMAPLYDLMSTAVYADYYKVKMAMKLSGEYKFKNVTFNHFEKLSEITGFRKDFIKKQVQKISNDVIKGSENLCRQLSAQGNTSSKIYEKIIDIIKKHSGQIGV